MIFRFPESLFAVSAHVFFVRVASHMATECREWVIFCRNPGDNPEAGPNLNDTAKLFAGHNSRFLSHLRKRLVHPRPKHRAHVLLVLEPSTLRDYSKRQIRFDQ